MRDDKTSPIQVNDPKLTPYLSRIWQTDVFPGGAWNTVLYLP